MTVEEFQAAIKSVCIGKDYDDLPSAFKQFITAMFNTIDTDGEQDELFLVLIHSTLQEMGILVLENIAMTVSLAKLWSL